MFLGGCFQRGNILWCKALLPFASLFPEETDHKISVLWELINRLSEMADLAVGEHHDQLCPHLQVKEVPDAGQGRTGRNSCIILSGNKWLLDQYNVFFLYRSIRFSTNI